MPGTRGIAGVLVAAAIVLGLGESASAATLKANYQLQGSFASAVAGAPDLTNLGTSNRFVVEEVDGVSRQVLAFPKGSGLALDTAGLVDPNEFSVALVFRLSQTSGFRRILDFSNSTADNGFYDLGGRAVIYGPHEISRGVVFDDSFAQVVFTSAAAADGQRVVAYVNGTEVAAGNASKDFDLAPGTLRFFQDNTSGPAGGEESAGAVACILVYDGVLTAEEVGRVAVDPALCPAPRPGPLRAKAFVQGKPELLQLRRSLAVDTGINVRCPIGGPSCRVRASIVPAGPRRGLRQARVGSLGTISFPLASGAEGRVGVRLSRFGARTLREAGSLRIRASAKITVRGGRGASAQQVGRVSVPRPPAFRTGLYSGTTSQGLPIFISVRRTSIGSVFVRWRARCADGKVHTNAISFPGERIRHGRFSFRRTLETGGAVRMSGEIRGVRASGTLSRTGASAFGTKCAAKRIGWSARAAGVETTGR